MPAERRARRSRFLIRRKIGRGGQGVVYEAEDRVLGRTVAIKVVHLDGPGQRESRRAFPREARMAARLQHPHIIPIYDVGEHRGLPYLVFEYVQGRTVKEMLVEKGAMPPRRALALFRPVLEAMAHAHERGVLHLDLTPGNILVGDRDVPRIMDFGLSQMMGTVPDTTMVPVGTLLYMSPEQFDALPPGPATDVRSLALILFEMLAGHPAVTSRTLAAASREITQQDIDVTPLDTGPDMTPLTRFLAGALARDPAQRYPNACAMLLAFDKALEERREVMDAANSAPSEGAVEFLLRRLRRRDDFPALSKSLIAINRMTSKDSTATADQISNVVLRDFALTNKLLKLANSAYYGRIAGEVRSVSHAISLIGFEQLRLTANSLTLVSHVKDRAHGHALRDLLVRSFAAGLLARHLARTQGLRNAEEAFICGMFQALGEILTRLYCPLEYEDIEALVEHEGVSVAAAAHQVLGIDHAALGSAVAREWHFPDDIVAAIAGLPEDAPVKRPADACEHMRDVAVLADTLCRELARAGNADPAPVFDALRERFRESVPLEAEQIPEMAGAALDKLAQFAPILGLNVSGARWYAAARQCVERLSAADVPPAASAAPAA